MSFFGLAIAAVSLWGLAMAGLAIGLTSFLTETVSERLAVYVDTPAGAAEGFALQDEADREAGHREAPE